MVGGSAGEALGADSPVPASAGAAPAHEPTAVDIPATARAHLTHAVAQRLAEEAGVAVLHLKGAALLPGIRAPGRPSSDADILVAPGRLGLLEATFARHGWERLTDVESGSAFNHAATWYHPHWGYADLHAHWPGPTVSAEEAFAVLSEDAFDQPIATVPCRVPGRTAQILVLLLHAARSAGGDDVESAWHRQSDEQRAAVRALATRLGALAPLAFAIGEPAPDDASAELWRLHREGGTRVEEWRARFRAARTPGERLRVLRRAARLNRDHLQLKLGRTPTRADLARAHAHRVLTLGREMAALLRRRLGGSGR